VASIDDSSIKTGRADSRHVGLELTRTEFLEATKLTESKSMQAMCQMYAAISYICIGDAESSSKALDLIGLVYKSLDSYVGFREKTGALFASGLLQMKQHNLQETRIHLANRTPRRQLKQLN